MSTIDDLQRLHEAATKGVASRCGIGDADLSALVALHNAWPAIHRVILAASDLVASHPASPMEMQALMIRLKKELRALDDKEQRT